MDRLWEKSERAACSRPLATWRGLAGRSDAAAQSEIDLNFLGGFENKNAGIVQSHLT